MRTTPSSKGRGAAPGTLRKMREAVGKSAEKIELVEIKEGESLKYYRENGVHYVPKLRVEDIII